MELIQKKLWKFHVPILNIIWDIAATRFEISWNTQNKKIAKEVEQYYFRTSSVSKTHLEGTSFILLSLSGLQGVNIALFKVSQLLSPTFGPFGAFATRMTQSVMVMKWSWQATIWKQFNKRTLPPPLPQVNASRVLIRWFTLSTLCSAVRTACNLNIWAVSKFV